MPGSTREQVYACYIDLQKTYDSVLHNGMFHKLSLLLKSMALSYTHDSEHILEIAMCSKIKSLYEVFHLHKKDYIRDVHAIKP